MIADLIPIDSGEPLSVEEAERYFHDVYLKGHSGARLARVKGGYKRMAKWEKATKQKQAGKQEFVWAPVEYEGESRPVLVNWDE